MSQARARARAHYLCAALLSRARAHDCASGHASEGAAFHGRGRGRLTAVSRIYVYLDAQKELAAVIAPPSGEDDAAGAPEAQAPYAGPGGPKALALAQGPGAALAASCGSPG